MSSPSSGGNLILATQSLARLEALDRKHERQLRPTIFADIDGLLAFHTSAEDAPFLVHELGKQVDEADLVSLGDPRCCARLAVGGRRLPVFSVQLDPPPVRGRRAVVRKATPIGRDPMRRFVSGRLLPLVVLAALAGCAAPSALGTLAAARGELLFVGTASAIQAVEPTTGVARFAAEAAQPLPDWSALVATAPRGKLAVLDGATGAERSSQPVASGLVVRVVSTDGRRAALVEHGAAGPTSYVPAGRERTTVWVAHVGSAAAPRALELSGNVEPEAFSTDGSALFALEWLPALEPDRYRVRRINLSTGASEPVLTREKVFSTKEMRGEGRQQVLAPDRQTLYTLHTAQPDHVHARDMLRRAHGQPTPMVHAFVHTLGLDWGWTYCIDLPAPFGLGPPSAHTIAVSPGTGARLYVADLSSGTVVAVRTSDLQVDRTATIDADPAAGRGAASATVGPDGTLYLGRSSAVLALDGSSLAVKARYSLTAPAAGLAPSADGQRLYVGRPNGVLVLSMRAATWLGSVPTAPFDLVRHVGVLAIR